MSWAVSAEMLKGVPSNGYTYIRPKASLTRAQAAALLARFDQLASEPEPEPEPDKGFFTPPYIDPSLFRKEANGHISHPKAVEGIDVSYAQGHINWNAVAESGIEFAIIRAGNRYSVTGELWEDDCFDYNIQNALAAGLDVGVYFFSQATSKEEAEEEARFALELVKPYDFNLPIFFDWETLGTATGRVEHEDIRNVSGYAKAFCDVIRDAGYETGIYYNLSQSEQFDMSEIEPYVQWFAQWRVDAPTIKSPYSFWQYGWVYDVPGIYTAVDVNLWFKQ